MREVDVDHCDELCVQSGLSKRSHNLSERSENERGLRQMSRLPSDSLKGEHSLSKMPRLFFGRSEGKCGSVEGAGWM